MMQERLSVLIAATLWLEGNFDDSLQILKNVRKLIDRDPARPDLMEDEPEKAALRTEVDALMALVRAELAG